MALVTLSEYKTYYGISTTTEDFRLGLIIDLVSDLVNSYLGRNILQEVYSSKFVSQINGYIYLNNFPLVSVDLLEYLSSSTTLWTSVAAYEIHDDIGAIEITDASVIKDIDSKRSRPIKISYVGGFSDTPADLKLAVFDLITYYSKRQQTPVRSFNSQSTDSSALINGSEMPSHIKRVLSLYRLRD